MATQQNRSTNPRSKIHNHHTEQYTPIPYVAIYDPPPRSKTQSALRKSAGLIAQIQYSILRSDYLLEIAACAAAKRAIGTRNGEQET